MVEPASDVELEEPFFPTNAAMFERRFPWIRIWSGFRIAIDPRRLCLALVAVTLWSAGEMLIWKLPSSPQEQRVPQRFSQQAPVWPWDHNAVPHSQATRERVEFRRVLEAPWQTFGLSLGNSEAVLWPLRRVLDVASGLVWPQAGFYGWLHSWIQVLWALTVTSIFGGAISRMAAVDVTRQTGTSLRRGLRYSTRRFLSFVGAPLITVVGLGLCWLPNAFAGLIARIPVIGESIVAALWILPLTLGFFMALIVMGVAAGWPLMIAAVATDGSDAFDALSRAYSYVFNRPWYALFLTALTLLVGSVLLYFFIGVVTLTIDMAEASVQSGYGNVHQTNWDVTTIGPSPLSRGNWQTTVSSIDPASQWMIDFWMLLLNSLPPAFLFSYFWTMSTILYVLLRRREDGAPLDEVAPDDATGPAPLPLVGIPAATLRETLQNGGTPGTAPPV